MGAIYNHLIHDHGATPAQAKAVLRGWEIRKLEQSGQEVGELMLQENEVHFALEPHFRRRMGRVRLMQRTLDQLLEEKGFLVTRLFPHDRYAPLVQLMGFRRTHADQLYDYYWMDKETRDDRRTASAN